jgi:hypothetical protein
MMEVFLGILFSFYKFYFRDVHKRCFIFWGFRELWQLQIMLQYLKSLNMGRILRVIQFNVMDTSKNQHHLRSFSNF